MRSIERPRPCFAPVRVDLPAYVENNVFLLPLPSGSARRMLKTKSAFFIPKVTGISIGVIDNISKYGETTILGSASFSVLSISSWTFCISQRIGQKVQFSEKCRSTSLFSSATLTKISPRYYLILY